jgi:hypothetical protein
MIMVSTEQNLSAGERGDILKIGFAFREILSKTVVPGQDKGVIGLEQSLTILPEDFFMLTPDMVFHL